MAVVTLHPNYVRKIAESYKLLRQNADADRPRLEAIQAAATRCINAHMRAELALHPEVKLPLATVLMMLQYVQRTAAERLEPVPEPQDFEQPLSPELRPFLVRAAERLHRLVAA
jgi:hypothetical protein